MVERTGGQTATRARILLVDDDPIILDSLKGALEQQGQEVEAASTVAEAIQRLRGSDYDLVITDVAMPDRDGFELLRYVKQNHQRTVVIFVARYGTIASAIEAIKQGAHDYLTKPLTEGEVQAAVQRVLAQRRTGGPGGGQGSFPQVVAEDYRMVKVLEMAAAVAESRTTVLITGESGTGKSLVARAIHAHSPRREGPFVEVACGALPETLLASELFGHVRGAFTDAISDKQGKFAAADGGTIFLDEISTASQALQVKLLRVLQDRQFEPVGSNRTIQVDVRVILATNRDLRAAVEAGRFRQDLYYRVNVINIELPPLHQRAGDIPLLAKHFLARFLHSTSKHILGFSPEAMRLMQQYAWPGNIRELENCIERAVVLCRSAYVEVEHLPPAVVEGARAAGDTASGAGRATLKQALADAEREAILAALQANGGNRQATARQLGINRTTLYKKMKLHGLAGI